MYLQASSTRTGNENGKTNKQNTKSIKSIDLRMKMQIIEEQRKGHERNKSH